MILENIENYTAKLFVYYSYTIMEKIVDIALKFAKSLIGIKYTRWTKNNEVDFYCDELPSMNKLKIQGINCTGLINVMMLKVGLDIPDGKVVRGGTYFWFNYFKKNKVLEPFDYTKQYPIGTLLIRKYRDEEDQGHVAVFYSKYKKDPTKTLYGTIIHAYDDDGKGQVGLTQLGYSHFHDGIGYYEYIVLPKNWLS
jgi:hypothetical protein